MAIALLAVVASFLPGVAFGSLCNWGPWHRHWGADGSVVFEGRLLDLPEQRAEAPGTWLPRGPIWACRFVLDRTWLGDLPDTMTVVGRVQELDAGDIGRRFLVAGNASPQAVGTARDDVRADVRVDCGPLEPIALAEIDLLTIELLSRHMGAVPDTTAFADEFTERVFPYLAAIGFSREGDLSVGRWSVADSSVGDSAGGDLTRVLNDGQPSTKDTVERAGDTARSYRRSYSDAMREFAWCVSHVSSSRLGAILESLHHEFDDPSRVPGVLVLVTPAATEGREGVPEWLVTGLRHPDPKVRSAIAEGLVDKRLTAWVSLLRQAVIDRVDDVDPRVGAEALRVYGQSRNFPEQMDACVETLWARFGDLGSPLRVPVAEVLATWIGSGLDHERTLELLRDRSAEIRKPALESLYKSKEIPAPIGLEILSWLDDPTLRSEAVDLLEEATHRCPELRARASDWLPKLDEVGASRVVARQFRLSGDDFLGVLDSMPRSVIETALDARVLSSSGAFAWQLETGLSSSKPEWRLRALQESQRCWPPESHVLAIYRCLLDQDPQVQAASVSALRVFSDPWVEEGIRRLEKMRETEPLLAPRVDAVIDSLRNTRGFGESAP